MWQAEMEQGQREEFLGRAWASPFWPESLVKIQIPGPTRSSCACWAWRGPRSQTFNSTQQQQGLCPWPHLDYTSLRHEAPGQGDSWTYLCSHASRWLSLCLSFPNYISKNSLTQPDVLFQGIWLLRGSTAFAKDFLSLQVSTGWGISV